MHHGHQRAVHVEDVLATEVVLELPDRLEEGKALDVAYRPAHLDDHSIGLRVARSPEDLLLDHVRDVRDHLHGRSEVVAAPLARDDLLVDLPGRYVGRDRQVLVDKPLVVPEVQVGLGAVIRDEHLAVLVGAHRAGVDVEIWVELLEGVGGWAGSQEVPDRGRCDALSQRGDDPPGHENVLRHSDLQGGFQDVTGLRRSVKPWARFWAPERRPYGRSHPKTPAPRAWAEALRLPPPSL